MSYIGGRKVNDTTGALLVESVLVVPATAEFMAGRAFNPATGALYVIENAAAPNAKYMGGEAFSPDGALYVTSSSPAGGVYIGGVLYSQQGARFVALSGTPAGWIGGIRVNSNGSMLVEGLSMDPVIAAYFASGQEGSWYDPSDFSTLFQDSAGTTPVTAVGQPIGKVVDKSGRGHHLFQATAGSRPTLAQDGNGKYAFSFDGVDDQLSSTSPIAVACATAVVGANIDLAGSSTDCGLLTNLNDQAADVDIVFTRNGAAPTTFIIIQGAGGGLEDATHIWNNQVQTNNITGSSPRVYSADGTGFAGGTKQFPMGLKIGQDRNIAARFMKGLVYGVLTYVNILNSTDRGVWESYIATKSGVTL